MVTLLEALLVAAVMTPVAMLAACLPRRLRAHMPRLLALAPLPALAASVLVPESAPVLSFPPPFRMTLTLDRPTAVLLGAAALLWIGAGAYAARHLRGEPNAARRQTAARAGPFQCYAPDAPGEPVKLSMDLVIDAVGAVATRVAASRLVKPGGVIIHVGLLPGSEGFDVRKITLQEIIVAGTYCYTPLEFRQTLDAIAGGRPPCPATSPRAPRPTIRCR